MVSMSTAAKYQYSGPEIWGGIECTINRVGDDYRDQLEEAGHYWRDDDLEKIAGTGIKKIRYPVLWEYHQEEENTEINWEHTSKQLARLRELGIEPIAGLLHHGSGPSFATLPDNSFPQKYARRCGE